MWCQRIISIASNEDCARAQKEILSPLGERERWGIEIFSSFDDSAARVLQEGASLCVVGLPWLAPVVRNNFPSSPSSPRTPLVVAGDGCDQTGACLMEEDARLFGLVLQTSSGSSSSVDTWEALFSMLDYLRVNNMPLQPSRSEFKIVWERLVRQKNPFQKACESGLVRPDIVLPTQTVDLIFQ